MQEGYARIYVDGDINRIEDWIEGHDDEAIEKETNIYLVIDRLSVDNSKETVSRLTDSCETAFMKAMVCYGCCSFHQNCLTTFLHALRLTVSSLKTLTITCFRSIHHWVLVLLAKALDVS